MRIEYKVAWLVADTLNDIIELNERMAAELDRVGTVVGKASTARLGLVVHGQPALILLIR